MTPLYLKDLPRKIKIKPIRDVNDEFEIVKHWDNGQIKSKHCYRITDDSIYTVTHYDKSGNMIFKRCYETKDLWNNYYDTIYDGEYQIKYHTENDKIKNYVEVYCDGNIVERFYYKDGKYCEITLEDEIKLLLTEQEELIKIVESHPWDYDGCENDDEIIKLKYINHRLSQIINDLKKWKDESSK